MKIMLLQEDAQKIADYLASRPWAEVNNLLVLLAKAETVENKAEDKAENKAEPKANN